MPRQPVHGILLLDKPLGLSSHAALARAKRALNAAKAGHTGTLDPLASGLLPLCLGEATKFASDLLDADKSYRATLRLGQTTTTGDAEGAVLESRPVQVDPDLLELVLARFRGSIEQIPPMYSALKRDGKPLYEYARAGVTLERSARSVTIHELRTCALAGEALTIDVRCSKGTYVRTLAEDIGRELGCGAHLAALRRTAVGSLHLDAAISLASFEALDEASRQHCLLPVDTLVRALPTLFLNAEDTLRFKQGQPVASVSDSYVGRVRVYAEPGGVEQFLGVGEIAAPGVLAPRRLLASGL
jgi:tRNA pseudouridine55 synthase